VSRRLGHLAAVSLGHQTAAVDHGKAVELVMVEASPGLPQDPAASLEELLSAPNGLHSTPVDRCRDPAATGYRFKRK